MEFQAIASDGVRLFRWVRSLRQLGWWSQESHLTLAGVWVPAAKSEWLLRVLNCGQHAVCSDIDTEKLNSELQSYHKL